MQHHGANAKEKVNEMIREEEKWIKRARRALGSRNEVKASISHSYKPLKQIPISHLMVISASSHCTLADVLPSFTTPRRVACLPVCLCTHRPPILNPPSTPPITANTGHTWWHSVRRCVSDSSAEVCRPLLPLSSSRSSSFSSCSSLLCAERLLRSLVAPAGGAPSRRQPLICWRR